MKKDKNLSDFLPDKNSVYYKKFTNIIQKKITKEEIKEKIKQVYDPEIPVNILDLGLIYSLEISKTNEVSIKMTLTSPNCPVAGEMPHKVGKEIEKIEGISSIKVELVWEPPWTKKLMSEDAKLALDIF
ncbi:MAG: hypothetical protein CFH19_01249 [Alphaproteobacteria bacterium MarineAlpha5_Bin9]|nr:MAG: hypothetical protein CFH19_01249 [Alphaproteobacteria bacterium MarineAlpha5_Bin9]|tara:strand:+ start:9301 stop:9687 length:387 start_codon:yes stop_codon:yes gene_type:complete